MEMESKGMDFIHSLVGKRLLDVCCAMELLTFDFSPLALHASGCARIIRNGDILVTTLDYQSWDLSESINNDEWLNVAKFHEEISGGVVLSVTLSPWHDLRIELDNGVIIECLIANYYPHYSEEKEQWVLFERGKVRGKESKPFLPIYNKSIDFIE